MVEHHYCASCLISSILFSSFFFTFGSAWTPAHLGQTDPVSVFSSQQPARKDPSGCSRVGRTGYGNPDDPVNNSTLPHPKKDKKTQTKTKQKQQHQQNKQITKHPIPTFASPTSPLENPLGSPSLIRCFSFFAFQRAAFYYCRPWE